MAQNQIRGGQIRSGTIANAQVADNAEIALSKIAGGTSLNNRVTDLESDAVVTREVPSGSVNGSNVTFTLANTPVAGSEEVFLNGLLQDPGAGNSYTISGAVITFLSAPLSGDEIHVTYATGDYMVAPGGSGGSSFTPFQWSTTEQVYPLERAEDGSTLYAKKIVMSNLVESFNGYNSAAHGIDVTKLFSFRAHLKKGTEFVPLPWVHHYVSTHNIPVFLNNTNILIWINGGNWMTGSTAEIFLIYKK